MVTEPLDLDAVAAAAGAAGRGDSSAPADRAPPDTDIGHVHLEVTSLPAFESTYVDGLGFEVGMIGPDVRFVAAGGYHHHLAANTWRGRTTPATGRGIAWFEVVIPDRAAVSAVRDRLDALGPEADIEVTERANGIEVRDSDGIRVRVRAK